MGLAHRVIPTLLVKGDRLVKGRKFDSWRSVGHPEQAVRIHNQRGVDELILLDIAATPEGRGPNLKLVERLADVCFMPLTVGGGVRSVRDVRDLLNAGADKVAICTRFADLPEMKRISETFGKQALCASVDSSDGYAHFECGRLSVSGMKTLGWAKLCANFAGEILLTSIDREGTMEGYDLELVREVSSVVNVPVIAHGGAGTYEHLAAGIRAGASAVAAGAMFQFTDQTPLEAARYLAARGIEARVAA